MKYTLEQYRAVVQKRLDKLRTKAIDTQNDAAQWQVTIARSVAPKKSGALISSIHRNKNRVGFGGTNPRTGEKYLFWIEQRYVHPEFGVYGESPTHVATGKPKFIEYSIEETKKIIGELSKKNFTAALSEK
jgi:hypothetical protein